MSFNQTLMVRHGSYYSGRAEALTEDGERESVRARDELIQRGIGRGAVLLSSTAPRALQTAAIIGEGLSLQVKSSKRIEIIGNYPEGVSSLDEMLEAALSESETDTGGEALIVVTHQPLINIAANRHNVGYGEIWLYEPTTWFNPQFSSYDQGRLQEDLAAANLIA